MDKMSLFSILTVSVPEAILDIYFGFLITGDKVHLYLDDRINIVRLLIAVTLMSAASATLRYILPNNFLLVLVAHIIVYILILKTVYKLKWGKSAVVVAAFMFFLVSIELLYFFPFMTFVPEQAKSIYSNDILRLLYSLPERVIQLFAIISLWNVNKVYFNIKQYKKLLIPFIGLILILSLTEIAFVVIFVNLSGMMDIKVKLIYAAAFFMFALVNYLLFRFISKLSNVISENEFAEFLEYKRQVKGTTLDIYTLINSGEVDSAKKYIQTLLK